MKINLELIQYINYFERTTKSKVKDCFFEGEKLIFLVQPGQARIAIGKQGINVKKFTEKTGKKIKIIEFNEDPLIFVKSLISPVRADNIEQEEETIIITVQSTKDKGLLIGRNAKNLENLKKHVQKYFVHIKDIKIQ
ncbi:NusA-like transcription termination signal-binding factor [Candidatus Woesearchaeota archaeon]|jgi:transcription termination/antitermination protein NusA|nr:NusA-like transcription termination signal-binding factor [Candidatus Woesearchaeota archaeon]MBT7238312.1 NusA-like transcription termination signal-binding factor [Candidatus Woesearchaeota archaeon]